MIKATIFIPLNYNDGFPVDYKRIRNYKKLIEVAYGAYTDCGTVIGSYTLQNGFLAHDDLQAITVICDDPQKMRNIAKTISQELKQESVYLELQKVNVEFITP